jgi:hypothetical protein
LSNFAKFRLCKAFFLRVVLRLPCAKGSGVGTRASKTTSINLEPQARLAGLLALSSKSGKKLRNWRPGKPIKC